MNRRRNLRLELLLHRIMLRHPRAYRFASAVLVAAIGWTFLLPIVHLACGMTMEPGTVPCAESAAHHSYAAHPVTDPGTAHRPMDGTDAEHLLPCTGMDASAGEHAVACCWLEASPLDAATPLPVTLALSPARTDDPTASRPAATPPVVALNDDPAPPLPLRVLFSVFLI